jgi:outer membrane protein assembly factor BamA
MNKIIGLGLHRGLSFLLFLALIGTTGIAQSGPIDSLRKEKLLQKSSLIPVPVIYYSPETRLGAGAAVLYAFRLRGQSAKVRPSQVQIGAGYTQEKQLLVYMPFQAFLSDGRWQVYGELGYYQYVYQFFGIGNETFTTDEESYDANFPRVQLNLLRQMSPNHYFGIRYWWDNYRIVRVKENGLLAANGIIGRNGGVISGAGLVWNMDTRDDLFYPGRGVWTEGEIFVNNKLLGSDFNFTRFSIDAAAYFSRTNKRVLALNAWLTSIHGDPPFQQLAFIGGSKKMRGYFKGRLRDKALWMAQAEYRLLLSKRFGAAIFSGVGAVSPNISSLFDQQVHFTFGAGLRFRLSKKDHINLRLDFGVNEQGEFFPYLTVKEAF